MNREKPRAMLSNPTEKIWRDFIGIPGGKCGGAALWRRQFAAKTDLEKLTSAEKDKEIIFVNLHRLKTNFCAVFGIAFGESLVL